MEPERETTQRKARAQQVRKAESEEDRVSSNWETEEEKGKEAKGGRRRKGKARTERCFTFRLPAEKEGGALERLRESLRRQTRKRREERRRCEPPRMVASMVSQVGRGGMAGSSSDEESRQRDRIAGEPTLSGITRFTVVYHSMATITRCYTESL